jgi:AraC family L-rhamnose operon transcriptional activator RhaR
VLHACTAHDFIEIVVVVSGTGTHVSQAGATPLVPGSVLVLRPGAWHGYRDGRRLCGHEICLPVGLLHDELAWLLDDAGAARLLWQGPLAAGELHVRLPPAAVARLRRLLPALRSAQSRCLAMGLFLQVVAELAAELPPAEPTAAVHPCVAATLRRLDGDLAQAWTVPGLARLAGVSGSFLSRRFRAATGLPPLRYLHRRRLEVAAQRLRHTHEAVATIGAAVGWSDANLFTRYFRAAFGQPPRAWRSAMRAT